MSDRVWAAFAFPSGEALDAWLDRARAANLLMLSRSIGPDAAMVRHSGRDTADFILDDEPDEDES